MFRFFSCQLPASFFAVKQAEENDRFVDIFSDEETDDGEDSGGEEEDHMAGLGDFLRAVDERREETKR